MSGWHPGAHEPHERTSRTTDAGPIALTITAAPGLQPALDELLAGAARAPSPPCRTRLRVELGLDTRPAADLAALPRTPSFRPAATDVLTDASAGWMASIDFTRDPVSASFQLRDLTRFGAAAREHVFAWVAGALRCVIALAAPRVGGLFVHGAAAVDPRRRALAFVGPSGAGKTTMTRRLSGWRSLSDDAALICPDGSGVWTVAGTPVPGRERLARETGVHPLGALVFIEPHAAALTLEPLTESQALAALMPRILYYAAPDEHVLAAAAALAAAVPAHHLASSLAHDPAPALARLG